MTVLIHPAPLQRMKKQNRLTCITAENQPPKSPVRRKDTKGSGLSKAVVEDKIRKGIYARRVEEIGTPGRPYITRYRLGLEVKTVAAEIRIYADDEGRFQIPAELRGDVTYGKSIKAIAAFLYSEGVVS